MLDRSGSMASIKKDMEGGLNAFFAEQSELPGKCLVDLVQFDNEYEVVYKGRKASQAKVNLIPRGSTALLDAIGKTVVDFGAKLRKMREDDRPGRVMVIVVTDGMENASREWTKDAVREVIRHQEDVYNWDFVFMGTNFDAVSAGMDYGFNPNKSLTFNNRNVSTATETLSNYTTQYRAAGESKFTDEDRKANA